MFNLGLIPFGIDFLFIVLPPWYPFHSLAPGTQEHSRCFISMECPKSKVPIQVLGHCLELVESLASNPRWYPYSIRTGRIWPHWNGDCDCWWRFQLPGCDRWVVVIDEWLGSIPSEGNGFLLFGTHAVDSDMYQGEMTEGPHFGERWYFDSFCREARFR